MNRLIYTFLCLIFMGTAVSLEAGNPDRQGEAGAFELLMNPWARSAGLHTMTTANISGVEAIRLNPAGLARVESTEIVLGNALYLRGTDIKMNAAGIAQRIGKSGAFGLTLMAVDFGDINVTTVSQPEGTGATYSPQFFNIGLTYAHIFENKVSVGITARAVSESIPDARASTVTLDAGVQYVTGEQDNFKFGISLRNVGGKMRFEGDGLVNPAPFVFGAENVERAVDERAADFDVQSMLNIGSSYDINVSELIRCTIVANYTSNAFSQDQIGGGLELSYRDLIMIRGGYKHDFGQTANGGNEAPIYTGIAAGVSLNVPVSKKENAPKVGIDYAYRTTETYDGTHNFAVRITL